MSNQNDDLFCPRGLLVSVLQKLEPLLARQIACVGVIGNINDVDSMNIPPKISGESGRDGAPAVEWLGLAGAPSGFR